MPAFNPRLSFGLGLFQNQFFETSIEIKKHAPVSPRHAYSFEPASRFKQNLQKTRRSLLAIPRRLNARQNRECTFLKLPVEIRLQIYRLIFDTPLLVVSDIVKKWYMCEMSVLFTCRLICGEALKILRSNTTLLLEAKAETSLPVAYLVNQLSVDLLSDLTSLRIVINMVSAHHEEYVFTEYSTLHGFPVQKFPSLERCDLTTVTCTNFARHHHDAFTSRTGIFGNGSQDLSHVPVAPWDRWGHIPFTVRLSDFRGSRNIIFFLRRRRGFVFANEAGLLAAGRVSPDALTYVLHTSHRLNDGACIQYAWLMNDMLKQVWKGDTGHWHAWVLTPLPSTAT